MSSTAKKVKREDLTRIALRSVLKYNPEDGLFYWKDSSHATNVFDNDPVGSISKDGYRILTLFGTQYRQHKLVWFYHHGDWGQDIDHINHDRLDNRIENLRSISHEENMKNIRKRKNNTGLAGIWYNKKKDRYISTIKMNGKKVFQKSYMVEELDKAVEERKAKLKEFGFHENHGTGKNKYEYFK